MADTTLDLDDAGGGPVDPLRLDMLRFLDGEADAETQGRLAARLREDGDARRLFVRLARQGGNIAGVLAEVDGAAAVRQTGIARGGDERSGRGVRRVVAGAWLAAAIVVVAAGFGRAWWHARGGAPDREPGSVAVAVPARPVDAHAMVTGALPAAAMPLSGAGRDLFARLFAGESAIALAEVPVALDAIGDTLVTIDENTRGPRVEGTAARGPLGREALAGVVFNPTQDSFGVRAWNAAGFFRHGDDVFVSFVYWMGQWSSPVPPRLVFGVRDEDLGDEFELALPDPVPVQWTTVVLRLADLGQPFRRDQGGRILDERWKRKLLPPRMQPGDRITMLKVRVEGVRQDVIFVDDLRVFRLVPDAGPPEGAAP